MNDPNLNHLASLQWQWVENMGWHNKEPLEYVALIAGEIGELVNECRGTTLSPRAGEEMADIVLRVLDMAHHYGIDIGSEVRSKMEKNQADGNHKGRIK